MDNLQKKMEHCLNCINKPCTNGCPLGNDIPVFIKLAKDGKLKEAYETLSKTTIMPFICGKICPKSKQCQGNCVRGIKGEAVSIGDIESYIGDLAIKKGWHLDIKRNRPNGKKVAIIGAGPAGITAGIWLAKGGTDVTIFEKREKIGGILRYGIPGFRLDKKYIDVLEDVMKKLEIKIITDTKPDANSIKDEFDNIIICYGANQSTYMGIPGEDSPHVYGANELLEYCDYPDLKGKEIVVIGGGNVAMDVARVTNRMGAKKVTIAYRRARQQMPAEPKEIEDAANERS